MSPIPHQEQSLIIHLREHAPIYTWCRYILRGLYVDIPAAQAKCKKERQITTSTATIFLLDPLSILLHSTYWEVDERIPSAKQLMVADLEPPNINSSWSRKLRGITIKFASNKSQKNLTWWRFGMIWSTLGAINRCQFETIGRNLASVERGRFSIGPISNRQQFL